ncbi:MAG: stage 0 sporulation family protein [Clostridia bacterium]|nr:stage 0 sporulation family protein [Clostridia bacterium]
MSENNETLTQQEIEELRDSLPEEVEIVGIRFKKPGKVYYFLPEGNSLKQDDNVIVKTARGLEYGTVAIANRLENKKNLVLPLRSVVRRATKADDQQYESNLESEKEAFRVCQEKIDEHKLDMKLVDVEYTFDNNKLLFYFTADGRVDFRELVKDLASVFKTRIELRQIGIRDETKLMGGLGVCGRPFCCKSFLSEFAQVSIKMAKEQNLSLNSSKISGACGKLMCCLRYEHECYSEAVKRIPKLDSKVNTPEGEGVVVETNPLAGLVRVRIEKDQNKTIKLFKADEVTKI